MSTIKILNDNGSFSDITGKNKYPLNSKINNYLIGLYNLRKDIKKSETSDDFLSPYNNKPCDKCLADESVCNKTKFFIDHDSAINRLFTFHNSTFGKILNKFHELDFDILLGGSSGLAAVLKKTHTMKGYEPKDMDIYLKDITDLKITQINEKINEIFPTETYKIVIIRRLLTLTWWIFDMKDTDNVMEIQLNMLNARSWADVFVVYHSDMVCVGYDIKNRQLITQTQRWNNFVASFPNAYVTNLNSHDQPETLEIARQKYSNRGFIMNALLVYKNIEDKNKKNDKYNENNVDIYGFSGNNEYSKTETDLINKLSSTYSNCSDIIISDDIAHMYDRNGSFPPIVDIDDIDKEIDFNKFVAEFEYPNGVECPVIIEKHNIMIANSNCMHDVSLKSYILMKKFKQCPLCRKNFTPVMYNAIKTNRDEALTKYSTMSKVNKYKNIHINESDNYFGKQYMNKKKVKNSENEDEDKDEDAEIDFDDIVEEIEEEVSEINYVPRSPRSPRSPRLPRPPREASILEDNIEPMGADIDEVGNSMWSVGETASWDKPIDTSEWGSDGETILWTNSLNSSTHIKNEAEKSTGYHEQEKIIESIISTEIDKIDNKKKTKPKPVAPVVDTIASKLILEEIEVEENVVEQAETAWTEVKPRRKRSNNNNGNDSGNKRNDSKYKPKFFTKKY